MPLNKVFLTRRMISRHFVTSKIGSNTIRQIRHIALVAPSSSFTFSRNSIATFDARTNAAIESLEQVKLEDSATNDMCIICQSCVQPYYGGYKTVLQSTIIIRNALCNDLELVHHRWI
jgi:hypothetical protein